MSRVRAAEALQRAVYWWLPLGDMGGAELLGVNFQIQNRGSRGSVLGVRSVLSLERVQRDVVSSLRAAAGLLGRFGQSQSQLACSTRQGRVRRENRH